MVGVPRSLDEQAPEVYVCVRPRACAKEDAPLSPCQAWQRSGAQSLVLSPTLKLHHVGGPPGKILERAVRRSVLGHFRLPAHPVCPAFNFAQYLTLFSFSGFFNVER